MADQRIMEEEQNVSLQPLDIPSSEMGSEQSTDQSINKNSLSISESERWKMLFEMQQHQMMELIRAIKEPSTGDTKLVLPEFNPESQDSDAKAWCNTVDLCMQEKQLSSSRLIIIMSKALKGTAATWLAQNTFPGITWFQLKDLFLARFHCVETPAATLCRLFNESPKEGECLSAYANRFLSTLLSQWHNFSNEKIAIAVTLAHAAKIEPRLQRLAFTTEIDTRVKLQQELMAFTYRKRGPPIQDKLNAPGDAKKPKLDQSRRCYGCGKLGHLANQCLTKSTRENLANPRSQFSGNSGSQQTKDGIPKKSSTAITCFYCGEQGHIATRCAKKETGHSDAVERRVNICTIKPAMDVLCTESERLNVLYERNWTRLVHEQLRKFESSIVAAARQSPEVQPPELAMDNKWTFSGALIYCITLITTIGYGNVSPRTAAGRAATVAYAAAGVPLTLACLAGLGASLARLARVAWLRATKRKVPNTWRKEGEPENYLQLHEQQRLLPQPAEHNQYTSFPPRSHRSPGTVKARAGDRGQYSQVFERAPASPRAATLGRVKRSALADEPHTSSSLQTQTLDRKKTLGSTKCLATVHGPGRGRGRSIVQRPRGAVIEQLIAEECGELQMNRSLDDLDDSEDPDESICPHDTPSRVPLIWNEENHKMKSCTVASSSASTSVQHHIHHGIEHCHIPVGIVLFLLLAYICVGAAIFSAWENWSFLDAAYFCFIALATIGFGDFVPTSFLTTKQSTEHTRSEYVQMIACCAYLVFGLILIAMSFSLLQDEVVARCSQLANSLGLSRQ